MTELHLACSADAAYVLHSAAMLHSVAEATSRPLVVHYLHGGDLPPDLADRLSAMLERHGAQILFHAVPPRRLSGLPDPARFGPAMWYRLLLPELLPEVERLLYLDIDTIALDRLDPVWESDLTDVFVGAVENVFMEFHAHRREELGISAGGRYFNSGVLLMNLALMRSGDFAERVLSLVRREGARLEWPDQDALNLTAGECWLELHPRWNCMNSFFTRPGLARGVFGDARLAEALARPAIRHFEGPGPGKPWHFLHDRTGQQLYRRHRRATPWPRYALDGASARNRVTRLMRDLRGARDPASGPA